MNMAEALDRARIFFPEREAIIYNDMRLTYQDFWFAANRAAKGLTALGVEKGDRVCLYLNNRAELMVSLYATLKLGAVCVSLSPMIKMEEVTSLVNDCGAKVLVTEAELAKNIPERRWIPSVSSIVGIGGAECDAKWEELLANDGEGVSTMRMDPSDAATMIYTSGTTGQSKGVVLSHGNLVSNTNSAKFMCGMKGEDRAICFLPMSHSFGQNFISNSCVQAACTLVIMKGFVPDTAIALMEKEKITRFYAVPPIYIMMMERPDGERAIKSVRYCFSAASSMPEEVARKWKARFGLDVNEGYGLTETGPFSTYNHEFRHKAGSVGTPVMNVEVRVVDADLCDMPQGDAGEILLRGPNVMKEYFGKPVETAEAVTPDGWLRTGDVGYLDEEGYLFLVDRIKDMINNAGLKVWPRQVEEVLYCNPNVRECAVIGVPHPVFGETVKAVVALFTPGSITEEELKAYVASRLSDYKVPRMIEFVEALPKNATGKILKRELRKS